MVRNPDLPSNTDFLCAWIGCLAKPFDRVPTGSYGRRFQDGFDYDKRSFSVWPVHVEDAFALTKQVTVKLADRRILNSFL